LIKEREKHNSALCCKHDGAHQWKDCPENWHNKNHRTTSNDTPAAYSSSSTQSKCKVKRTELKTSQQNSPPIVRFDDIESDNESGNSSIASQGELMHIISKTSTEENLHTITILTLLDKNQTRIACTTLLDQCRTNNGIFSRELTKMLNVPTYNGTPKTFIMAAGTFTTDKTAKLTNATLPCLLPSKTFTLELMIVPEECNSKMN
jgi:hypothetical protein